MILIFLSFFVPIAVYFFLPLLTQWLSGKPPVKRTILIIAGLIYFVSWYLPSPKVDQMQTAFMTHFVGGGIFSGIVWVYVRKQLGLNYRPLQDLVFTYILVSALGVANELFEFFITRTGLASLTSYDTWWDLVANTSGALLFWFVYFIYRPARK